MHVLRRPHRSAVTVTLIAAVLALVLTFAMTSALSDVGSTPASGSAPSPTVTPHASAGRLGPATSPFMRSPFSSLLSARVAPRWSQHSQ